MRYEDTEASWLDHRTKGMPGGMAPMPLAAIGTQGWNVLRQDLPLPLAVLKESASLITGAGCAIFSVDPERLLRRTARRR